MMRTFLRGMVLKTGLALLGLMCMCGLLTLPASAHSQSQQRTMATSCNNSDGRVLGGDPSYIQVYWSQNCQTNWATVTGPTIGRTRYYWIQEVDFFRYDNPQHTSFSAKVYCSYYQQGYCYSKPGVPIQNYEFTSAHTLTTDSWYAPVDNVQVCFEANTQIDDSGASSRWCSIYH